MRVPGYCMDCRRIKYVTVTNMISLSSTPVGRCGCKEQEEADARRSQPPGRGPGARTVPRV